MAIRTIMIIAMTSLWLPMTSCAPRKELNVIDLSHSIKNTTFYFKTMPGAIPYNRSVLIEGDILPGVYISVGKVANTEHTGTHVDLPSHYVKGGVNAADVPVEWTIADGVKVDCREEARLDRAYLVTVQKLQEWEEKYGKIPNQAAVIFDFDWSELYEDNITSYTGSEDLGNLWSFTFPSISPEAGVWLLEKRDIKILGVDSMSPDPFSKNGTKVTSLPNHVLYMHRNRIFVENIRDPTRLPARGFRLHASPARYTNASGIPVRAYAIIDNSDANCGPTRAELATATLVVFALQWIMVRIYDTIVVL